MSIFERKSPFKLTLDPTKIVVSPSTTFVIPLPPEFKRRLWRRPRVKTVAFKPR